MKGKRVLKLTIIAALIAAVILLISFFPKILTLCAQIVKLFLPFILGYLVSLVLNPVANLLEKRFKLPRAVAAILVMLIFVGVLGGIVAAVIIKIVDEVRSIYENFPAIYVNMTNAWTEVWAKFSNIYDAMPEAVQELLNEFGNNVTASFSELANREYTPFFRYAGNFAKSLPKVFISSIVFLLTTYFMISDAKTVSKGVRHILSGKSYDKIHKAKEQIKAYLGNYVKAQLIIMFFVFIVLIIGFNIMGIEYSLLIALGTAFLDALPFFGSGAVLITWGVISLLTSEFARGAGLLIIYLCVVFVRQMIEPKIVSQKIGMNPIFTLMAMYIGYRLFSIGGIIAGPLLLMLFISLYRAGIFDTVILFFGRCKKLAKNEIDKIKEQFEE